MPLQNPASQVSWEFVDYTGKTSSVTFDTNENLGAVGMAQQLTDLQALEDAFAGISGGAIAKMHFSPYVTTYIPSANITNENIQRERCWIVVFTDESNGEEGQVSFPCARVSDAAGGSIMTVDGLADMTRSQWTEFKDVFERVVRSVHGNNVTMKYAYIQDNPT